MTVATSDVRPFQIGDLVQVGSDSDVPEDGSKDYGRVVDISFDGSQTSPAVVVAMRLYGPDKYEQINVFAPDGTSEYERITGVYSSSRHLFHKT